VNQQAESSKRGHRVNQIFKQLQSNKVAAASFEEAARETV